MAMGSQLLGSTVRPCGRHEGLCLIKTVLVGLGFLASQRVVICLGLWDRCLGSVRCMKFGNQYLVGVLWSTSLG